MSRETLDDEGRAVIDVPDEAEPPAITAEVEVVPPAPRIDSGDHLADHRPGAAGAASTDTDILADIRGDTRAGTGADAAVANAAVAREILGDVGGEDGAVDAPADADLVADLGVTSRSGEPTTGPETGGPRWAARMRRLAPAGTSRRGKVTAATLAAVLVATLVAVTAYVEGGRARERSELDSTRLIVWSNSFFSGNPDRMRSQQLPALLYLTLTSALPVTVQEVHLRIGDAVPMGRAALTPGQTATVSVLITVDCSRFQSGTLGNPDGGTQTATIRTSDGSLHDVPVTVVGDLDQMEQGVLCDYLDTPQVRVSSMVASRDGAVSIDLSSLDERPIQLHFISSQYSDGVDTNWRIDVSPSNPILIPPHGRQSVVIRFRFRQCFADRTLPSTGGLITALVRATTAVGLSNEGMSPDGWDDSAIASAAAAAVTKACS
jgi:hypothetical protein